MNLNLLKTYLKLMLIRNKLNYLLIILSIIAGYITVSVVMVYIDNVLILSSESIYPDINYIYIGIRTVLIIGGIILIINQYYNIMKSGLRDYCILKSIGATRINIRILILLQVACLLVISIPVGLYSGYLLSNLIIDSLGSFSLNSETRELIDSTETFFVAAGIAFCVISFSGIYIERGIHKMPLNNILSHQTTVREAGLL
ncbi:MAG TPA: FtsX-like permease family protein [Mobilitalea sp.]|nr:FtsX-like permease family protein [Mobilitalea sp.]